MESLPQLTEKETAILEAMVEGLPRPHIAERLDLSVRTVEWHINKLRDKFDCPNLFLLGFEVGKHYGVPMEVGTVEHSVSKLLKAWLKHNEVNK